MLHGLTHESWEAWNSHGGRPLVVNGGNVILKKSLT